MKSYIEPLNAADALDVLDLYGIDTPGAFFSSEHEGCVEVELSGHTALLETPESVAMLFGHDAATALCQHSNFRRDAAEIMSRALDLDDFLYNVYSGTAFIPDKGRTASSSGSMSPISPSRPSSRTISTRSRRMPATTASIPSARPPRTPRSDISTLPVRSMMKSSSPRPIGRCAISSPASSRRSGPDAAPNWQGGRSATPRASPRRAPRSGSI